MSVLKLIGKVLLAVVAIAVIAVLGLYLSDPLYYRRMVTVTSIDNVRDVDWYKPLEIVKGNPAPPLPVAPEDQRTIAPEAWEKALAYAKERESFALMVWHRGAIQYQYFMPGFKPEDRTDPASMGKSIVSLAVGLAIAQGAIQSVDDPVVKYIPEWANDDRKKITIRHLLTMSSGLAREPFSPSPFSQGRRLVLGTDIEKLALSIQAEEEPGKVFAYYNFNSQLLGLVVERATKKRYAEFLSEALWSKLGTRDARVYLDREGGLARTYCCLQATAEDWVRVGLMIKNYGKVDGVQVVPEAYLAEATSPSAVNPNYGFQIWLGTVHEEKRSYGKGVPSYVPHSEPFVAPDVIYFDGAGGQRVYVIRSQDMVIVRTGRGGVDFKTGAFLWDDAIIPNALLRGVKPVETAAAPAE
jgi:CubicO group peptidase (beta-lactamase class C family)